MYEVRCIECTKVIEKNDKNPQEQVYWTLCLDCKKRIQEEQEELDNRGDE